MSEHTTATPETDRQEESKQASYTMPGVKLPRTSTDMRELLLSGLSAFPLFLFAPLAWLVHKHDILPLDIEISRLLQKNAPRSLHKLAKVLSYLDEATVLNSLAGVLGLVLWRAHRRLEALMLSGTCLTGGLIKHSIQRIVNRPRPK